MIGKSKQGGVGLKAFIIAFALVACAATAFVGGTDLLSSPYGKTKGEVAFAEAPGGLDFVLRVAESTPASCRLVFHIRNSTGRDMSAGSYRILLREAGDFIGGQGLVQLGRIGRGALGTSATHFPREKGGSEIQKVELSVVEIQSGLGVLSREELEAFDRGERLSDVPQITLVHSLLPKSAQSL